MSLLSFVPLPLTSYLVPACLESSNAFAWPTVCWNLGSNWTLMSWLLTGAWILHNRFALVMVFLSFFLWLYISLLPEYCCNMSPATFYISEEQPWKWFFCPEIKVVTGSNQCWYSMGKLLPIPITIWVWNVPWETSGSFLSISNSLSAQMIVPQPSTSFCFCHLCWPVQKRALEDMPLLAADQISFCHWTKEKARHYNSKAEHVPRTTRGQHDL